MVYVYIGSVLILPESMTQILILSHVTCSTLHIDCKSMHALCHVKTVVLVAPSFTLKMAATKDNTT